MTWVNYGYQFGLVPAKKTAKPVVKSQLPEDLQKDLWALQPAVA